MKIVSFAVWVECGGCGGERRVPGGRLEFGELVPCAECHGKGVVPGVVDYADFAKLIDGLVRR